MTDYTCKPYFSTPIGGPCGDEEECVAGGVVCPLLFSFFLFLTNFMDSALAMIIVLVLRRSLLPKSNVTRMKRVHATLTRIINLYHITSRFWLTLRVCVCGFNSGNNTSCELSYEPYTPDEAKTITSTLNCIYTNKCVPGMSYLVFFIYLLKFFIRFSI